MPYGTNVFMNLKGSLSDASRLPAIGSHIGDAYNVNGATYVWITAPTRVP